VHLAIVFDGTQKVNKFTHPFDSRFASFFGRFVLVHAKVIPRKNQGNNQKIMETISSMKSIGSQGAPPSKSIPP
jgi:hypothetical protein